jgi:peptidoglycan/LPS O-acetylase OafA/YrhL
VTSRSFIFLTILSTLLIIPACALAASDTPADVQTSFWYVFTFFLGAFAGMAEILSRYRDEPWKASLGIQGLIYMVVNGFVSMGAYWVLINHKVFPTVNSPGLPAAIVSGLGSMAIFRSKIFVYRSPEGKEYPMVRT